MEGTGYVQFWMQAMNCDNTNRITPAKWATRCHFVATGDSKVHGSMSMGLGWRNRDSLLVGPLTT